MKYEDIIRNPEILEYYRRGNENLGALGYTDHSVAQTHLVAGKSAEIMLALNDGINNGLRVSGDRLS